MDAFICNFELVQCCQLCETIHCANEIAQIHTFEQQNSMGKWHFSVNVTRFQIATTIIQHSLRAFGLCVCVCANHKSKP